MRIALLLLGTLLLSAAPVEACSVPCGRIYPLILMQVPDQAPQYDLARDGSITLDAMLTYRFDMLNEGYTAATPNEPIVIRFEYPRKPAWAEISVEPEAIPVDVTNPLYVQPDTSEPTNPQASYVFTAPISITVRLTGQAILRDGYDYHKLLVFAKSTESGLYQAGYGIKEIRIVPEGALHEADIAGSRDVFEASPLPPLNLAPGETSFAGTHVSVTPPASAKWWEPAEYVATIDPAPTRGRAVFALHDEWGGLVASTSPRDASAGELRMNATLVKPGRHTATVTLLPAAGTLDPPMTFAIPLDAGALDAEGFVYPKTYLVTTSETIPAPLVSRADPLAQFVRDIPFWVFDTAQGVSATVTLKSTTPVDIGRSGANLQFSLHDPDGNLLQAGSVDPTKPTWPLRVGSVAVDGWYVLRVNGVGAPLGGGYDTRIEVNYPAGKQERDRADGTPDPTGPLLGLAGANLTLPLDTLAVWTPSDITPNLDTGAARRYQITIVDAEGTPVYASGMRTGAASFSAPSPGTYRAFAFAEPITGDVPFSPIVRAFTFDVGAANITIATTFAIDDGYEAPFSPTPTNLGFHAIHTRDTAGPLTTNTGDITDPDGNPTDGTTTGTHYVRIAAASQDPRGSEIRLTAEQTYPNPVTLTGPNTQNQPQSGGLPIPSAALAIALIALGATAITIALVRRR